MARKETGQNNYNDLDADRDTPRIRPLVENQANRQVLIDWIEAKEDVTLADGDRDLQSGEFDCLIVDTEFLQEKPEALIELKERQELVLPIILLVERSEERRVRLELRRAHPELFDAINAVVAMPIAEYRLADQIESLLRIREQSKKLSAQRKQLRAIRDEHAGHGVVITDPEGRIEYVNSAFEEQSGYSTNELIGEHVSIVQSGIHDESFYSDLWDTILSGEVWQGEITNEQKDGERYVVNMTIAPISDVEGEIERFIGVNHEITELKELETSLRKQTEQLEILNRVLRHDIRNDLTVILGWTDLLEDHVDAAGQTYLDRITDSGQHIVELTEVAGDLAGNIDAEAEPELEPVDFTHLLETEVQSRRESLEHETIELRNEVPAETTVRANSMLSSVFRNLINNAIQHNDAAEPKVEIRSIQRDEVIRVEVADNGPGIPEDEREQIFAEAQKGLDSEGTGMGLYLVHSLVETYGGDVWVENNKYDGATFIVELPTAGPQEDTGEQNP